MTNRIDSPDQARGRVSDENFQFSSDFQREFNKACAEFVDLPIYEMNGYIYRNDNGKGDTRDIPFDPCNDANDRELVEDAMDTDIMKTVDNTWLAAAYEPNQVDAYDKARKIACIKCIAKVLGVAVDDEDVSPGAGGGL